MTSDREANLLRVLTHTSWRFYAWFGALSAVALWGLIGYIVQLRWGLIVTGLRDQTSWGLYIANFVFFTGISYGGTLISAILRLANAGWRHPITRLSEAITVFALCVGGPMVMVDLGRPDRMMFLFTHERIQSVILWDVLAISTYLLGCAIYLYLPMIPDLALLAERQELAPWRRKLYRKLTFGWTGTSEEQHLLEKTISRMAILMIVLAVSVHTVVSYIFAMTLRPGWNSSNFGAYFVMGAIYSGTAAVVLSMYILLRVLHLDDYIKPIHFRNLALLLVTFSLLYLYFNINEYMTSAYKIEGPEKALLHDLFFGNFAMLFWSVLAATIFIPLIMMASVLTVKRLYKFIPFTVAIASGLIVIGAWCKRFLIVVPTLGTPYLSRINTNIPFNPTPPFDWLHYRPTWVEWSITFGGVAIFLLMYMLFTKLFPMVSIWETRQDEAHVESAVATVPQAAPQRLGSIPTTIILLIACVLFGAASHARAAEKVNAKQPEATTLSLEWQRLPAPAPVNSNKQTQPREETGVALFFGRMFGWVPVDSDERTQDSTPEMLIIAKLRDSKGQPLAYQVVSISLKTSFGVLDYGGRPTDAEGKVQFRLSDRRHGEYPVEGKYDGGDKFAAAHAVASVDFGPRPDASLPTEGILISPNATPWVAIPFTLFFGVMWLSLAYFSFYIVCWRLPQIRKHPAKFS